MIRFISLSSGSAGNCYFLGNDERGILIDAGVSLRYMKKYFQNVGLDYDSFSSILVTHDHMDHIRNLGSYCKRIMKAVYATPTLLAARTMASDHVRACARPLEEGKWNEIDGFMVRYFVVPHDATQTVGYAIMIDGHKFVIMTDIGRMTEEAISFAQQADTVVVESNYDMDMLISGPYTHDLKMRICQGNGHLSNDECAQAIRRFWHPGLKNLFLCHLSENNNTPELAYRSAEKALAELGVEKGTVNLRTLPRRSPSPLMML
ncbi:MAG: MBL fold metallo-hydrolase [Bacteroidales bacterium]|nr:MBL fold metallo-hydrolase [Bacteroidales bacterium]